jgi:hypothetical protein
MPAAAISSSYVVSPFQELTIPRQQLRETAQAGSQPAMHAPAVNQLARQPYPTYRDVQTQRLKKGDTGGSRAGDDDSFDENDESSRSCQLRHSLRHPATIKLAA